MRKSMTCLAAGAALLLAGLASAETWTLDGASSKLAFGSIKKDLIGEVHSFDALTGTVDKTGAVSIEIDLNSVETLIDIRNERMREFVFKNAPSATLTAQIDMDAMAAMEVGSTGVVDFDGVVSFLGTENEIYTELFVARLSETQVMVTTNDMVFLAVEDLGISAGIDKLQEIAELPSITRAAPVTVRLMFTADDPGA